MIRTARAGTHWSKLEISKLANYWAKNLPIDEIATLLGRSIISIECAVTRQLTTEQKAKRQMAPRVKKKWTSKNIEILRRYWLEGYTDIEISRKMGCSVHSITQAAAKYLGEDAKRRPPRKQQPKQKINNSLCQWTGPVADEHDAWLRMIKAKTPDEKQIALIEWQTLRAYEQSMRDDKCDR